MIEVKPLNKQLLKAYLASPDFGQGDHIPISRHRGISHCENPNADDQDVLLLIAVEDHQLMGYLGVLPDYLFLDNNAKLKIGWLSCFWVAKQARGKGIGSMLLEQAIEAWNHRLISADYVPATKKIYDRTNAFSKQPFSKQGIRLYILSDLQLLLPPKHNFFQKNTWLLRLMDRTINVVLKGRLRFLFNSTLEKNRFEYIENIDAATSEFLTNVQAHQYFRRNESELNWMIQFPWILSPKDKDSDSTKYYFTSVANKYRFKALKIFNDKGDIIAFMVLADRDQHLKIPYLYHSDCIDVVRQVLEYHLYKWQIKTCTFFHQELIESMRDNSRLPFYQKAFKRNYLVASKLKEQIALTDSKMQDGDGDCGFT